MCTFHFSDTVVLLFWLCASGTASDDSPIVTWRLSQLVAASDGVCPTRQLGKHTLCVTGWCGWCGFWGGADEVKVSDALLIWVHLILPVHTVASGPGTRSNVCLCVCLCVWVCTCGDAQMLSVCLWLCLCDSDSPPVHPGAVVTCWLPLSEPSRRRRSAGIHGSVWLSCSGACSSPVEETAPCWWNRTWGGGSNLSWWWSEVSENDATWQKTTVMSV